MRSKLFSGTKSPYDIEQHVAPLTRQFDGAKLKNYTLCFQLKPIEIWGILSNPDAGLAPVCRQLVNVAIKTMY